MARVKTFGDFSKDSDLKVGIYFDKGVTDLTVEIWNIFFDKYFHVEPTPLDVDRFVMKNMEGLDLIVMPGGKSLDQSLSMPDEGKKDLKAWVQNGGKVLSVCAGFFFMSSGLPFSLDIIPVTMKDVGDNVTKEQVYLDFEFTDRGKEVFGTEDNVAKFFFHGGPVMDHGKEFGFETLLNFKQEIPHANEDVENFSIGRPAAVLCAVEKGAVIGISPHIERTFEHQKFLSNAIKFLTKQ